MADKVGEITLFVDNKNSGESSVRLVSSLSGKQLTVPATTLQQLLADEGYDGLDALKLDVEGAEDLILEPFLRNAPGASWPRMIVIEDSAARWQTDLLAILARCGYRQELHNAAEFSCSAATEFGPTVAAMNAPFCPAARQLWPDPDRRGRPRVGPGVSLRHAGGPPPRAADLAHHELLGGRGARGRGGVRRRPAARLLQSARHDPRRLDRGDPRFRHGLRRPRHAEGGRGLHHRADEPELCPADHAGHRAAALCRARRLAWRTLATSEGQLFDARGRLMAHGTETCAIFPFNPDKGAPA